MIAKYSLSFENGNINLYWRPAEFDQEEVELSYWGWLYSGNWTGDGMGISITNNNIEHAWWYYNLNDPEYPQITVYTRFEEGNGAMNTKKNMVSETVMEIYAPIFPLRQGMTGGGINYHAGNYVNFNGRYVSSGVPIHWTCDAVKKG